MFIYYFNEAIVIAKECVGQARAATCSVVTLLLVDSYLYGDLFTTLTKLSLLPKNV